MNCFRRMSVTSLLAACVALVFGASSAHAQKSSVRPIRLVIPLTAGGGADTKFVQSEYQLWGNIIRQLNLKAN